MKVCKGFCKKELSLDCFNLIREDEQRRCFNWRNLQPLWGEDNLEKGDNYTFDTVLEIQLYFAVKSV